MKCIVCVKQVPDTSGVVAVKEDGTMDRAAMATITNHDDLAAVEAALRIKDATGCKVVVVSMGPPPAEGMLRELLAMGCDEAVLVSAREFGGSDTFATCQILAAAIKKVGVDEDDIVFCGRQAIDGDTAQVGPQIAEKLHLPQVSYVAEIAVENKAVTVKRLLEDGYMTIKVQTPCLLTCVKELNDARYMSVGGIMECYNKPLEIVQLRDSEGRSPHRRGYHRPERLSHECVQVLLSPGEGRRYDDGGRRQGDRREAGLHPQRQAHHLIE